MATRTATVHVCDSCEHDITPNRPGLSFEGASTFLVGKPNTVDALAEGNPIGTHVICRSCLDRRFAAIQGKMTRGGGVLRADDPPAPDPEPYAPEPVVTGPRQATGRPCITEAAPAGVVAPLAQGGVAWT